MANDSRFVWHDLMTLDLDGSEKFYGELFGWKLEGMGDSPYRMLLADGKGIGGMMTLERAAGMPSHWMGYIGVGDCAAAAATVKTAGGQLHKDKTEIPNVGWFAVATDPQGAAFMLF